MSETKEPTPEELAEIRAAEHRQLLADCAEDRRAAKDEMLARNAKRIDELTAAGLLKDGETLEQYDTRVAKA
jgi:hypothetical protein